MYEKIFGSALGCVPKTVRGAVGLIADSHSALITYRGRPMYRLTPGPRAVLLRGKAGLATVELLAAADPRAAWFDASPAEAITLCLRWIVDNLEFQELAEFVAAYIDAIPARETFTPAAVWAAAARDPIVLKDVDGPAESARLLRRMAGTGGKLLCVTPARRGQEPVYMRLPSA